MLLIRCIGGGQLVGFNTPARVSEDGKDAVLSTLVTVEQADAVVGERMQALQVRAT